MNRIPFVSRTLDVVQWLGLVIGVAMIVAMAVLMNVEIAGRTLIGVSTQMSDEFAGYFFTAATMLCFLPALREGRFLRVEGLVALAPARIRAAAEAFAALLGAGTCLVLASATWELTAVVRCRHRRHRSPSRKRSCRSGSPSLPSAFWSGAWFVPPCSGAAAP